MVSPASHNMRVVRRSALAGVAGVGRRHPQQPLRHVSPRRRRARRPILFRSILYLIVVPGPLSASINIKSSSPSSIARLPLRSKRGGGPAHARCVCAT